jgi:hypothetical protein
MIEYQPILEINTKTGAICYFLVDIDGGKTFDYRARVSINAFFSLRGSVKNRRVNGDLRYAEREPSEISWMGLKDSDAIKVDSVWEFYELIGYNYKTKKYKN